MEVPKAIVEWEEEMGMHWHENMYLPKMVKPSLLDRVRNFEFASSDVLVSTYPRSGTTWTQELTWLVLNDADVEKARRVELKDRSRFIEFCSRRKETPEIEYLEDTPPPRLIKTHFVPQYFEDKRKKVGFKTIIVMRNLRDVLVSLFYFSKNLFNFKGTWDDFFEMFREEKMLYGSWAEHSLKCWGLRDDPNVLILKYEDMLQDPEEAVRKIADFCGKTLSDEQIGKIAEFSDFGNVKKRHSETADVKNNPKLDSFLRKGTVGDSGKWFSEEQEEYVKHYIQNSTEKVGLHV